MEVVLKSAPYSFQTIRRSQATTQQIISDTQTTAAKISANGTLLFFYSGHGSVGSIGETTSQQIAAAVASGHYARLIMIIEACNSGSFARGSTAIPVNPSAYRDLIVVTAAKADESSVDDGTRSLFPMYMEQNLKAMAQTSGATIADLITQVLSAAKSANPGQSGDVNVQPQSVLNETLVGGSRPAVAVPGTLPSTAAVPTTVAPATVVPATVVSAPIVPTVVSPPATVDPASAQLNALLMQGIQQLISTMSAYELADGLD
jgi:hypothetical protein